MKNHQTSRPIPRFLITVFVLIVVGTFITGFLFYQAQQKRIKSEAENYIAAIADLKSNQIVQWRRERIADGELLLNNLPLLRTVETFLQSSGGADRKQELLKVMKSFQVKVGYESSILFDAKGKVRLAGSEDSWYQQKAGKIAFHNSETLAEIVQEKKKEWEKYRA